MCITKAHGGLWRSDYNLRQAGLTEQESQKEVESKKLNEIYQSHLALFVDDKDALLYYKKIFAFTIDHLKTRGFLYFEINENLGRSMERLLKKEGFDQINLQQDLSGKDRIIRGIKIK